MAEGRACDYVEEDSVIYCVKTFGNVYGGGYGYVCRFAFIKASCDVSVTKERRAVEVERSGWKPCWECERV